MEHLEPTDEYFRLNADVSPRNANFLFLLSLSSQTSLTEHIRRATAYYLLSLNQYESGGHVQVKSPDGEKLLPLFDSNNRDELIDSEPFHVNVNKETAEVFSRLGIGLNNGETTVIDNVINHYALVVEASDNGHRIEIVHSDGEISEVIMLES